MDFIEVVEVAKREAKGEATQAETAWLHDPANYPSWVQALQTAIQDINQQIDYQRDRLDRGRREVEAGILSKDQYGRLSDSYEAWSKKANRYRLGLEQRLAEITVAHTSEVERLRVAIMQHRYFSQAPHSDADHALWAAIDL